MDRRLPLTVQALIASIWTFLRITMSAVVEMLALVGGIIALIVMFWDKSYNPSFALDDAIRLLRANMTSIFQVFLVFWIMVKVFALMFSGSGSMIIQGLFRSGRRAIARHEAAHALVATVLRLPVLDAHVNLIAIRGYGGTVTIGSAPAVSNVGELYGLLARRAAVSVASAYSERSVTASGLAPELQSDWIQALEASWIASSLRPDRVLVDDVMQAVTLRLRSAPWTAAISEAARMLLRAQGRAVPAESFVVIANRFDLDLPEVEAMETRWHGRRNEEGNRKT